jgi:hypothetical protein
MTTKLDVTPDLVVVDKTSISKVGLVTVEFSLDGAKAIIWHCTLGEPWRRRDEPAHEGSFMHWLHPGEVFQVAMYSDYLHPTVDPNSDDPFGTDIQRTPLLLRSVAAIFAKAERTDLITDKNLGTGGTWFRSALSTSQSTYVTLEACKADAFYDGSVGLYRFPLGVPRALTSSPGFQPSHSLTLQPLRSAAVLPGNDFNYLVLAIDNKGSWQKLYGGSRTLKRKVIIEFEKIHVSNDGGDGENTAEFHIWVMEGVAAVNHSFIGDVDNFKIWDKAADKDPDDNTLTKDNPNKENIGLRAGERWPLASVVIGPKAITSDNDKIGILTSGICHITDAANERANNFRIGYGFPDEDEVNKFMLPQAELFFPTGLMEKLDKVPFQVSATRQSLDDEFAYEVVVNYSVDYA